MDSKECLKIGHKISNAIREKMETKEKEAVEYAGTRMYPAVRRLARALRTAVELDAPGARDLRYEAFRKVGTLCKSLRSQLNGVEKRFTDERMGRVIKAPSPGFIACGSACRHRGQSSPPSRALNAKGPSLRPHEAQASRTGE